MRNKYKIKNIKSRIFVTTLLLSIIHLSCKKGWLDEKSNQQLVVPVTIADFQAILDNDKFILSDPYLGDEGCDDYYLTNSVYSARSDKDKNVYVWAPGNVFAGANITDWTNVYQRISYANTVLEGIQKISLSPFNQADWGNIKGSALFYRAYAHYVLAQIFCKPYTATTADVDLGVILRLSSNLNIPSKRATVQQTYSQIINDLTDAKDLLPMVPLYKSRPSKPAFYAMMARVLLSMEKYVEAGLYADSSIQLSNTLIDFNQLSLTATNAISLYNQEVLYHVVEANITPLPQSGNGLGIVDSSLYKSYNINDLRKVIFFKTISSRLAFAGSYNGDGTFLFSGLATDEMYLIRAECKARNGNTAAALQDLNALLIKRFKTGSFTPITAVDADDALAKILAERRKELCFRGIRWTDLRRLNKDNRFATTITRVVNNSTYTLLPNDQRYVYPIPDNEILYSDIQQNPR